MPNRWGEAWNVLHSTRNRDKLEHGPRARVKNELQGSLKKFCQESPDVDNDMTNAGILGIRDEATDGLNGGKCATKDLDIPLGKY